MTMTYRKTATEILNELKLKAGKPTSLYHKENKNKAQIVADILLNKCECHVASEPDLIENAICLIKQIKDNKEFELNQIFLNLFLEISKIRYRDKYQTLVEETIKLTNK